jgi:hypothetical protein
MPQAREKPFVARFDDHVIVKGERDTSNFSNSNLLYSLLSLLSAQLSEAGSRLKFSVRNDFR